MIIGTPQYMPPEQLEGKRPTPANDLWALGATLYHAVEGCPPFDAEGLHALAIAVFSRPQRPPTQAGPLTSVLDALLTKDPAHRANAAEAAELLESVLRGAGRGPVGGAGAEPVLPHPAPDTEARAVAESGPTPLELPALPDHPTPVVTDSAAAARNPRHPVPERPATPPPRVPVPHSDDLASLGGADHKGRGKGDATRRRAFTRRSAVLSVALATLAVGGVLTWTLTRDHLPGDKGGDGGSGSPASSVTVVIGVDAPLSGDLSDFGLGIKNSADLAVRTANRTGHVPGVTFELKALDDESRPAKGQQNATQFIADDKVLGVVGPLSSFVAQSMVEPLAQANLVTVSPANSDPTLTQGADWAKGTRSRPYETYFRTIATDTDQGTFAAQYLRKDAKKTKLFVIDDNSSYGTDLTIGFRSEFTKLGGTIVGTDHVDRASSTFATLAAKVRASGADAVYYGGDHVAAGPLSQQIKQAGAAIPLIGSDGIFAPKFAESNDKTEGDLATDIGTPVQDLAGGRAFLSQYEAAGYAEEPQTFGAYAYDATWAVIEAVKAVAAANGGTLPSAARARMSGAVAGLAFDGVTGHVAFDKYGDTTSPQFSLYAVKNGAWTFVKTGPVTP